MTFDLIHLFDYILIRFLGSVCICKTIIAILSYTSYFVNQTKSFSPCKMRFLSRPIPLSVSRLSALPSRAFATHLPYALLQNPSHDPTPAFLAAAKYDKATWAISTAMATAAATSALWHLPDVSINERASRLSQAVNLFTATLRSAIFVAYKGEVKGNPTESEAYVAADRSDEDPLPPEKRHTIQMPAGEAGPKPTESEENVRADHIKDDLSTKKKK